MIRGSIGLLEANPIFMNPVTSGSTQSISNEDYKKRVAMLEKPWADCSVEEKLEKIREELTQQSHMSWSINNLQNEVSKLKEHNHKDGKVVVPLNSNSLNGVGSIGGLASRRNILA